MSEFILFNGQIINKHYIIKIFKTHYDGQPRIEMWYKYDDDLNHSIEHFNAPIDRDRRFRGLINELTQ